MRPLLAVIVWVLLIGGLMLYSHGRETVKKTDGFQPSAASGAYSIEVTTTFAAEPDPFALKTEAESEAAAVLLRVNGKEILNLKDTVEAGKALRVDSVGGLVEGKNELYLEANPPLKSAGGSQAVRVRVLRDGVPIEERSFWSELGSKIATTFTVQIERSRKEEGAHEPH